MTESLMGKVALITGGARGLGAATAMRLAELGASVHVADLDGIDAKQAPGLAAVVRQAHRLDVADSGSWAALVEDIGHSEGRLDILHLNAGVQARPFDAPPTDDPLSWLNETICERLVSVNIKGVTNGIMAGLPLIREAQGAIVITASLAGVRGFEADPLYSMTKFAVVGLTRALGPRLARDNVCISAVCPGGIDTRMIAPSLRGPGTAYIKPADVAELVCHLITKRDQGGVWLVPMDGTVRKYEIDPLDYTEDGRMSLSDLALA